MVTSTDKLSLEIHAWRAMRDLPQERVALKVTERVLNNADIAIRQRNQKSAIVTIASDFEEGFAPKYLNKANRAYDRAALEARVCGCRASKKPIKRKVAQMNFLTIATLLDLEPADLKKVQKRLRQVRALLRAK